MKKKTADDRLKNKVCYITTVLLLFSGFLFAVDANWGTWPLEGTGTDLSGNNHTLDIFGTVAVQGLRGKCLAFEEKDYLQCKNTPVFSAAFTISLCAQIPREESDDNAYLAGNARGAEGIALYFDTKKKIFVLVCNIEGQRYWITSRTKEKEKWYYLVGVYDGASAAIFVNGKLEKAVPVSGKVSNSKYPVMIGCRQPAIGQCPGWLIDEVSINERALTAADISAKAADYSLTNTDN